MTTLSAVNRHNEWAVEDSKGGVWYPNTEATEEIAASDEPSVLIVQICTETPRIGVWHS